MQFKKNNEVYDYTNCNFEVTLKKKKTFGFFKRYVYFKNHELVICKQPFEEYPRKVVPLDPFWYVYWIKKKEKSQNKQKILKFEERTIGFRIMTEDHQKVLELYGEQIVFQDLRKLFAKQLFETNFLSDFDILDKIGKGKYAKVYLIRDKITKQQYAAKYMDKDKISQIEFGKDSLLNELNILRMLDHSNCIKLVRTYVEEKGYFIVTQLLNPKKTLQDELQKFRNPHFGFPLIKNIMKELLEGLCYVHSLGIMHRDLKPQNIMFADSNSTTMNNLKIIDFGLAQFTSAKRYMYVHVGTPGYVAPEILANESESHTYTELCDIFSAGVIFHILLTGKSVFQGNQFNEVLKLNKRAQINLQGKRYQEMNADALNLLTQMLNKNPRLRITAKEALQHPYFIDNKSIALQRTNSFCNFEQTLGENYSPVVDRKKKHSLQFFERYKQQSVELSEEQQKRIIQQLKSPENIKKDQNSQKQMLYKVTKQLVDIFYNAQQQSYSDNYNVFGSTASPLKFMQKSRINSVDSSINNSSPKRVDNQDIFVTSESSMSQYQNSSQKKNQMLDTPIKKYSFSNQIEVFKEEDEESRFDENLRESGNIDIQQQNGIQEPKNFQCSLNSFSPSQKNKNQNQINKSMDKEQLQNYSSQMIKQQSEQILSSLQQNTSKIKNNEQISHIVKNFQEKHNSYHQSSPKLDYIQQKYGVQYKRQSLNYYQQQMQQQQNFNQKQESNDKNDNQEKIKYPKELILLLDYFPEQMCRYFLQKQPDFKIGIRHLGLFLLFGTEKYIKNDNYTQINRRFDQMKKNQILDEWFIHLIKDMIDEKIDLLNLYFKLQKQLN